MKSITMRAILFDLDGVLVEAKTIHFEALNSALGDKYSISLEDHHSRYDGLKTFQKLDMLTIEKGLPEELHKEIWCKKQELTLQALENLMPNNNLKELFTDLKRRGFLLGVCSNSIKKTVLTVLSKLDIISFFDVILGNEDVANSKPHPEIYWKAMAELKVLPKETIVVEDSPHGLIAAKRANVNIVRVKTPNELNLNLINSKIDDIKSESSEKIPWEGNDLNILIPMAGAGSRFAKAGYTFPKPLIEIRNKPMIQVVVENLNVKANFIYIVQKEHSKKYNLQVLLNLITPNCKVIEIDGLTDGAACTTLLAEKYIDNDKPLMIANSDQFIEWNSSEFFYKMSETDVDGGILTFESTHPKWSFAKINKNGYVSEVAEKNPISNLATVGIYYWKKGQDYVHFAKQMIDKDERVNGEFYVCPVYNEAIKSSKKFLTFNIEKMWGIGTPEDLNYFLENYQ